MQANWATESRQFGKTSRFSVTTLPSLTSISIHNLWHALCDSFLYSNLSKTNERLTTEKHELEDEVKHFRSENEKLEEVCRVHHTKQLLLQWNVQYSSCKFSFVANFVFNMIQRFFLCWCNVLRWIWCLWCYSECISTPGKLEKYAFPPWPGIFFKPARCGYTLRA
jgi:hypothetical protein